MWSALRVRQPWRKSNVRTARSMVEPYLGAGHWFGAGVGRGCDVPIVDSLQARPTGDQMGVGRQWDCLPISCRMSSAICADRQFQEYRAAHPVLADVELQAACPSIGCTIYFDELSCKRESQPFRLPLAAEGLQSPSPFSCTITFPCRQIGLRHAPAVGERRLVFHQCPGHPARKGKSSET